MSDLYAVMGNPIQHSKSPQIHTAFAEQTDQDLVYSAILVPLGHFKEAVDDFFGHGCGLNITVPFKEQAWQYADTYSSRALRAGAVNTLIKQADGDIHADNTDGVGLVTDLSVNHGCVIEGKRVLVLGAGGAVRGILEPLLAQCPRELVIANRTLSKAEALIGDFDDLKQGCQLAASGFSDVHGAFDLIINGTSASLSGELPPLPTQVIQPTSICYDMMYGAEDTVFNAWAKDLGAQAAIDGLGMLAEQAAEAFYLWRGVRPQTQALITELRDALQAQPS